MSSNLMYFLYFIPLSLCIFLPMVSEIQNGFTGLFFLFNTLTLTLFNFVEARYFDMSAYSERNLKIFKVFNVIGVVSTLLFVLHYFFDTNFEIYDMYFKYLVALNLPVFIYFAYITTKNIPLKLQKTA